MKENEVKNGSDNNDTPLPATLRFVLVMGVAFAILWFAMFALLKGRW